MLYAGFRPVPSVSHSGTCSYPGPPLLMADGKVQEQQAEACDVLKASVQNWQMGTSAHSPQPTASHMDKPNINGPGTNILPTLRRGSASSPGKGAQGM